MTQDGSGHMTKREACESNTANDISDCRDWDTGTKYRDIRNARGERNQVAE
jgi:hypothetical protein